MIKFYKIDCITNLHVGSGDVNYNIIDNEVEKDPVTGYPMIHSSGVKGALRDHFSKLTDEKNEEVFTKAQINYIFGKPGDDKEDSTASGGSHKFLDANIIARPLRVESSIYASLPVLSIAMINNFISLCSSFGKSVNGGNLIESLAFGDNSFLVSCDGITSVEGEPTGRLSDEDIKKLGLSFLKNIVGENFAIAKNINEYDLPVLARNCLVEGKENLWFEEIVPHGSIFYFAIISPDTSDALSFDNIVQFGAHSSIGRGFCKVTELVFEQ